MAGLNQEQLLEMRSRCDAATPGPWRAVWKGNSIKSHLVYADGLEVRNIACGISPKTGNADFIAHARADIPALLCEVERANDELSALKADIKEGRLVRVVRCKDCKNGVRIKGVHSIVCDELDGYGDPDDYCMYGELR